MHFRIGNGYDVHRFADEATENASIIVGGVTIPHQREVLAHSDGDVLIHALCDALLGALGLGDIGKHFPDTDEQYRGISSLLLLEKVYQLIQQEGWQLGNADLTVVAEKPKLAPYIAAIKATLAKAMQLDISQVSVKATTTEGLGFAGRQEGIAAYAVVLITQPKSP